MSEPSQDKIEAFKKRIEVDGLEFCESLYKHATIRLLCHKYAYYVLHVQYVKDYGYDHEEKDWFVMGRALGHLKEDETSPCIDFDHNHPLASEGISLSKRLKPLKEL